ncbi:MAG: hypothetical protein U0637_07255 [Phycisphaerales bacterium]
MMRCLRCNYAIGGVIEPRCPECGLPFNRYERSTYRCEGDERVLELAVKKTTMWTLAFAPWCNAVIPYLAWVLAYLALSRRPTTSDLSTWATPFWLLWAWTLPCGLTFWAGPVALFAAWRLRKTEPWIRVRDRRAFLATVVLGYALLAVNRWIVYPFFPDALEWWAG